MDSISRIRMTWRVWRILVFLITRSILMTIQEFLWRFNGTAQKITDSKKSENYDRCAHVVKILYAHDHYIVLNCSLENFIYTHDRFENPRYIFENDHVTLLATDEEYAVFGEARNKDMHLWKLEYGSFLKTAQVKYCSHLILVPLEHFHRMAEELGDPTNPIIFLFNTGRCGSTLMVDLMEKTEQCVSISEPCAMDTIERMSQCQTNPQQIEVSCRDIVRWICRPYQRFKTPTYFIKLPSLETPYLPLISKVFPRSHYLFMYRDVVDNVKSFYRLTTESPIQSFIPLLAKFSISWKLILGRFTKFGPIEAHYGSDEWASPLVYLYVNFCTVYLNQRRCGLRISAVRYEDFVEDPIYSMSKVLEYCDLLPSEVVVNRALDAMKVDSQKNSNLAKHILKPYAAPQFTERSLLSTNKILAENDFPTLSRIGEAFILEGTITRRIE